MSKQFKNLLLFAFLILFAFSCKKQSKTIDITKPIITIAEPMANDTISIAVEAEAHVEFTITDEAALSTLSVILIQDNSDTLINQSPSVNGLTVFAFHQHAALAGITSLTPMKAIIKGTDKGGNEAIQTIDFFVAP